jgi:hypothetical protein
MSKWDDRVTSHGVDGQIASVLTALENLSDDQVAQAPENIDRLLRVVHHVRDRVTRTPAELVTLSALNAIQQHLAGLSTELGNFTANGNPGHLDNANNNADLVLDAVRLLPPLPEAASTEAVASDAERVRRLVSAVAAQAEDEVSRVRNATESLQQATSAAQETFAEQAGGAERRVAELRGQVEALTRRLEESLIAQQATLNEALTAQRTEFDEAEQGRAEAAQEAAKHVEAMFTVAEGNLTADALETLNRLEKLKNDAEAVVGAIGVAGIAKGYSDTAEAEQKVANTWRYATVAVAVLAAGVLGWALFIDHTGAGSWQRLVTRLVVSVSFAGLAAYCGRQSEQHRKVERDARNRHLQLAALNAYTAHMPEQTVVELRAELAPGYFTPSAATDGDREDKDGAAPISPAQLVELVRMLASKGASN